MPTRSRSSLLLAAVAIAGCAPTVWAAKPKLYKVSLDGDSPAASIPMPSSNSSSNNGY